MAASDVTAAPPNRVDLARHARRLSWTSLAWLGFEGVATAAAGLLSGSVALLANGLDSGIEAMASVFVVWRFAAPRINSEDAERKAQRLVSISFFLLAPYVAVEAVRALVIEHHAHTTWVGVGLSLATLSICPWLGRAKLRLGDQLGSSATAGEGRQNLLCAYLAAAVLIGLLANNLFGLWWLDPVVALGIAGLAVREGLRSWRGESCECVACGAPAPMSGT